MTIAVTTNPQTGPKAPRATNQMAEAHRQPARRGQKADGKQRAGNRFNDGGQDRRQWRVGAFRRSPDRLAVEPAAEREPLGAVETRWIGTDQHPPADGQQGNPGDGEHRADPVDEAD